MHQVPFQFTLPVCSSLLLVSHSLKPIKGISRGKCVCFVCFIVAFIKEKQIKEKHSKKASLFKYLFCSSSAYSNIQKLHTEIIIGSEPFKKSLLPSLPQSVNARKAGMVKILREQRSYAEIAKLQDERGSSVKLCGCGSGSFPFIMSLMVSQHSALGGNISGGATATQVSRSQTAV